MKRRILILALLVLVTPHLWAAENAVLPESGPEDGGLRMRLMVAPLTGTNKEGYAVRLDLLNVSEQAITLRAAWRYDETGDLKDYLDAATSIECVPAVQPWIGQIVWGQRKLSQPEQVLSPGGVLSVRWQTEGRHLKNRVVDMLSVQNPEFPFPGQYSVHATLRVTIGDRTVQLRSNEQLVSVGGSRVMPKSTFGELLRVEADGKTALLSLGSLQKIEPGDQFEYHTFRERVKLTVTTVDPDFSIGNLEVVFPTNGTPPTRGMKVRLIQKK
jgi:hypothetical protein